MLNVQGGAPFEQPPVNDRIGKRRGARSRGERGHRSAGPSGARRGERRDALSSPCRSCRLRATGNGSTRSGPAGPSEDDRTRRVDELPLVGERRGLADRGGAKRCRGDARGAAEGERRDVAAREPHLRRKRADLILQVAGGEGEVGAVERRERGAGAGVRPVRALGSPACARRKRRQERCRDTDAAFVIVPSITQPLKWPARTVGEIVEAVADDDRSGGGGVRLRGRGTSRWRGRRCRSAAPASSGSMRSSRP